MTDLLLLERELEHATRFYRGRDLGGGRYVVAGWPQVDHPGVIRRWLGVDAVADDGCLADPEAAGWALAWIRWWKTCEPGPCRFPAPEDDEVVAGYLDHMRSRLS
jgi:hypothetical protein